MSSAARSPTTISAGRQSLPNCGSAGPLGALLLIADGARWIRGFFTDMLHQTPRKTMLLDRRHL
jgi:hypothetical protein